MEKKTNSVMIDWDKSDDFVLPIHLFIVLHFFFLFRFLFNYGTGTCEASHLPLIHIHLNTTVPLAHEILLMHVFIPFGPIQIENRAHIYNRFSQ